MPENKQSFFSPKVENNNFKIAKDIVASYKARVRVIGAIAEDTQRLLEEFKEKREKISRELKEALAKHESLRKKDFDKMMEDILCTQKEREDNVKKMLADFQIEGMVVVGNLNEMLKKGEKLRLKDFKKTLAKIRQEQEMRQKQTPNRIKQELKTMQTEVHTMLENFKKEREKVAWEWEKLWLKKEQ